MTPEEWKKTRSESNFEAETAFLIVVSMIIFSFISGFIWMGKYDSGSDIHCPLEDHDQCREASE